MTVGGKRPGEDELNQDASNKVARLDPGIGAAGGGTTNDDHGHGDFSGSIKKKIAGSSRTGQACDRCKIRKIRCDARPGGCSPCLQNNTECKTTDRITGRATSRGHTEQIETENTTLKMYLVELQHQLRELGAEPKPPPNVPHGYIPAANPSASASSWGQLQNGWNGNGHQQQQQTPADHHALLTPSRASNERKGTQMSSPLPDFRAGCIGDNYLGVSSETNWLSPIEGTSLALFGTKIDLSEFMPSETDPASTAMSYQTFLNYAFGRTKPFAPQLPEYAQCCVYAEWYFRSIQQFLPLIHKPDFMDLLSRIHHEAYSPSPAETVMVHMMLAIINFQFSARNGIEQARQDSMAHYHYALSFIPDLITGHKLDDIQALAVICAQLRNQPRPGAAWMFTNMVMGLAIESGLHRSAKAWAGSLGDQNSHQLEMRKRIFWSLLSFHVHLSGKLGRPMPFRMEDFDIEMPEPLFDNLPTETNLSDWRKCSWRAAIEGFKMAKMMLQIYSSIYSIRSTGQYEMNVGQLEKDLESFVAQIPVQFRGGSQTKDEDRISALYLDVSVAECQLLLHHPSLCRSVSPEIMSHNLDVCLHWSSKLLAAASQLKDLKSLDTTWYYSTDFLAAIFTTLFAHTERRDQMTSSDLQRLRGDMDQWLDVFGEIGNLLGTGPKLRNALHSIIEFALNNINRHIVAKTASAAVASADSPVDEDSTNQQQLYQNTNNYNGDYSNGSGGGDLDAAQAQTYLTNQQNHTDQTQTTYQSSAHFGYSDAHTNGMTYSTANMSGFDANHAYGDNKPNLEVQLAAHNASLAPPPSNHHNNYITSFQPSPNHIHAHANPHHNGGGGAGFINSQSFPHSAAWRNFADSMMTNMNGQEYMTSAGALMALSGGKSADGNGGGAGGGGGGSNGGGPGPPGTALDLSTSNVATMGNLSLAPGGEVGSQAWPLIHYHAAGNGEGPH